jgi:hypothetical protein
VVVKHISASKPQENLCANLAPNEEGAGDSVFSAEKTELMPVTQML